MEEIQRVLLEGLEKPDPMEEDGGGDADDDGTGSGGDTEEDDDSDDYYDDDSYEDNHRCSPYYRTSPPVPLVCPGASYTTEEAEEIAEAVDERNYQLMGEWCDLFNNNIYPLPPGPVHLLPKVTRACVAGFECYHLRYWTEITSETDPAQPYFSPSGMMQVFSLKLSSPLAHPVTIYGTFAIRDSSESLRNYIFNRSRDDPAAISPGCSILPLCSPSRGIYVLQYLLIDVDLWIKEEGDVSADTPLFRGYVEENTSLSGFGTMLAGRFQGDCYGLDIRFSYVPDSIETVIEVIAEAEHPSIARMSALTNGFDKEIALYDGTFCGTGAMVKHFVAAKKSEQLHVLMKLDGMQYKWSFQAGVGLIVAPEHPISGFTRYFIMNVSFRTRGNAASGWQWSCICNNVRKSVLPP
ncbi:hypothetical protein QOZ80_1AG0022040 [Eleusine coracana subsp. coracana]|nr:hypothetical protein QOZ80_1AG0022040 [Eleusine coracana subsp. coracana]